MPFSQHLSRLCILLGLTVMLGGCMNSQQKFTAIKIQKLMTKPDKIYCHGEIEGRYREVMNRDVVPYMMAVGTYPICREFLQWEAKQ